MLKNAICCLILAVVMVCCGTVFAQNKVVVIPMSGEDLKPLANVISVAEQNGDFSNPIAAMDSITDASDSNPYIVVMAPGIYDLGSQTLTVKPHVTVQGSGIDRTVLLSNGDNSNASVVQLVENTTVSDMTIRQLGTQNTIGALLGVTAHGENFTVSSCKIEANNTSNRAIGFSLSENESVADGVLDRVEIIVAETSDQGLGEINFAGFSSANRLIVRNSRIKVLGAGTAIAALALDQGSNNNKLIVSDTVIELLAEGAIGIGNTDSSTQLYRNVTILSGMDNVFGLRGAGSGFDPIFESSRVELSGSGTVAVSATNGQPEIRSSYLEAEIILSRFGFSGSTPTISVDNTVLKASGFGASIAAHDVSGGELRVRFGASKLDANTFFDPGSGTIEANCANSYDRNYDPLSEGCN